ncbi:MAG: hypothetical protein ABS939_12375 [Psychrobacillus sp.]
MALAEVSINMNYFPEKPTVITPFLPSDKKSRYIQHLFSFPHLPVGAEQAMKLFF